MSINSNSYQYESEKQQYKWVEMEVLSKTGSKEKHTPVDKVVYQYSSKVYKQATNFVDVEIR